MPWNKKQATAFPFISEASRMDDQLASAMAVVAFTAVLVVAALFHIERIHALSTVGQPSVQMVAQR
jgi:hypothetical protein